MQKQKRNSNIKRKDIKKKPFWIKKNKRNKTGIRKRRIFKNKLLMLNPTFQQLLISRKSQTIPPKKLSIRITPNNIFCTLVNTRRKKTISVGSSGIYKVKTSKKTLRYTTKIVIGYFLRTIKKELDAKRFIINIVGPKRIRKAVIKQLAKYFRKSSLIINVESKKCFNGCRPAKKRRKKQKGLRVFK